MLVYSDITPALNSLLPIYTPAGEKKVNGALPTEEPHNSVSSPALARDEPDLNFSTFACKQSWKSLNRQNGFRTT